VPHHRFVPQLAHDLAAPLQLQLQSHLKATSRDGGTPGQLDEIVLALAVAPSHHMCVFTSRQSGTAGSQLRQAQHRLATGHDIPYLASAAVISTGCAAGTCGTACGKPRLRLLRLRRLSIPAAAVAAPAHCTQKGGREKRKRAPSLAAAVAAPTGWRHGTAGSVSRPAPTPITRPCGSRFPGTLAAAAAAATTAAAAAESPCRQT
jgi:hypothetical protein